jgi:hypothetical protein
MTIDVEYVGQHSFNTIQSVNLNSIDLGAAFLTSTQDPTAAPNPTPGAASLVSTNVDLVRSYRGFSTITQRYYNGWNTSHTLQFSLNRRFSHGVSFGFNDSIGISDEGSLAPRLQHGAAGTFSIRDDQAQAQALLGKNDIPRQVMKANFVWDLPDLKSGEAVLKAIGYVVNDWQLSGIWTGRSGSGYNINFSYQSGGGSTNLTGSPDYTARIKVIGDAGSGCATTLQTVQYLGVPRARREQRWPRVGRQLHARVLPEHAGSGDRAEYPARRRAEHPTPGGHVQCAQLGIHQQPEYDARADESHRSADQRGSSVRSDHGPAEQRRQPHVDGCGERQSLAAEERRIRRRNRLPGGAKHSGADSVHLLIRQVNPPPRETCRASLRAGAWPCAGVGLASARSALASAARRGKGRQAVARSA